MNIIKLYTKKDSKSYFKEIDIQTEKELVLGHYSKLYHATGMQFREFEKNAFYDWHNAPQKQYIVYLEGEVEIESSNGEKRIFKSGDVLLAMDLNGKGHVTRTLTKGKSIIIKA